MRLGRAMAGKTIWLMIQDNSLPQHGSHNRHFCLAKYLVRAGYRPVVFVASKARCSKKQMIADGQPFIVDESNGFPWVYIRTNNYGDSMKKRLVAICEYHEGLKKHADEFVKTFGKPDVILGSSAYPLTPKLAITLAKRYNAKSICEVRDLWPASLEEYGIIKKGGPIARAMYQLERSLYEDADAVVFTMEGGSDYIADKRWDIVHGGKVDLAKCHYINNGVDLEQYRECLAKLCFENTKVKASNRKKACYAGSIRNANGIGFLVDVAKCLKVVDADIDLFIIGDGVERPALEERAANEGLDNIHFLGAVGKEYVPSALSAMSMMLLIYSSNQNELSKYGMSQNKLFEYLASGKPVLSNLPTAYSIVNGYDCGVEREFESAGDCAAWMIAMLENEGAMSRWGRNAANTAELFSYERLANELIEVVKSITEEE